MYPELAMGVYNTRDHQRIVANLLTRLRIMYWDQEITLEPFSETMLDDDKASATPDISLSDNEQATTPVIIEICRKRRMKSDFEKVVDLIENFNYGIEEGFVYNYESKQWLKYEKNTGEVTQNASFSATIQKDLNDLL